VTMAATTKHQLADWLMDHAAGRLRRRRPEWAEAMISENAALGADDERLRWSAGCALASYRAPGALEGLLYPAALAAGVVLMSAYQWSADESLRTVAVLSLIGVVLGAFKPRYAWISGLAIGLVVSATNSFETLSGLRPAYETHIHTLLHDARWTVLVAPALTAAIVGGHAGRMLRTGKSA